ncbi:hypothetical protein APHAL10511_005398 [Amanita phalloides]|nr:hypothetical protein APHAL10511_005398 [Amanita phalloides]
MSPHNHLPVLDVEAKLPSPRLARHHLIKGSVICILLTLILCASLLYPYLSLVRGFLGVQPDSMTGSLRLPLPDATDIPSQSQPTHGQDEPLYSGDSDPVWTYRKGQVKNAFKHALAGYLQYAYPNDELAPLTGTFTNKFNAWGVSLIDSLDTMWIMGLKTEFGQAMEHVASMNFTLSRNGYIPFFETTIRYLGGLLSAYALSGETILLSRADDLGQKLLLAFNATASGMPAYSVHPTTGSPNWGWMGPNVLFAEVASCQLEFKYLARMTGRLEYYRKAENVMSILYRANVVDGLFPERWDSETGEPIVGRITAGAAVDSGYEYLLKQYLMTGDTKARDQYIKSANGIINHLLYVSPNRSLLYATDLTRDIPSHRYEHLTCFLPGMLALGAHFVDGMTAKDRERHLWAARGLAYTCYVSYVDQESRLGPDVLQMRGGGRKWVDLLREWEEGDGDKRDKSVPPGLGEPPKERTVDGRDYTNLFRGYLLRPETVESLFYLWKATGDDRWRERGWEIFQAIEEWCKANYGYATVNSVDIEPFGKDNDMPSWFLAETLKYLYLLFDDTNSIPLDRWVFNTEAHPLPVFSWAEWEKRVYNISY